MYNRVYRRIWERTGGKKLDMILVQAFPANRTLSAGIIRYLSDYFDVHFIDLPGFHPELPVTTDCHPHTYTRFVERKIAELNLDSYILAGISFGFLVANHAQIDREKCIAILGSGPYLGVDYVQVSWLMRLFYLSVLRLIDRFQLENLLWGKTFFRKTLSRLLDEKSEAIMDVISKEVEPRAFIRTAIHILTYRQDPRFKNDVPHIILVNPYDSAIKFEKTLRAIWQGVDPEFLRVILTKTPHYPPDPSYEFFQQSFTHNEIESLFNFLDHVTKMRKTSTPYPTD